MFNFQVPTHWITGNERAKKKNAPSNRTTTIAAYKKISINLFYCPTVGRWNANGNYDHDSVAVAARMRLGQPWVERIPAANVFCTGASSEPGRTFLSMASRNIFPTRRKTTSLKQRRQLFLAKSSPSCDNVCPAGCYWENYQTYFIVIHQLCRKEPVPGKESDITSRATRRK